MGNLFSSSHLLEMVKLCSSSHLCRWLYIVLKSLRDGDVFFKLASLEMVKPFSCSHLWRWIYIVFKSLRDGEVFFKLASLRDGEAFFKLASQEMDAWFSSFLEIVKLFSSSHLLEMMKLFSKIHLWRWIHGHHQVIISGAFLQRWCSIFQRFISGDGNVVLVPSSLLLIRDMVNVFLIIASPSL